MTTVNKLIDNIDATIDECSDLASLEAYEKRVIQSFTDQLAGLQAQITSLSAMTNPATLIAKLVQDAVNSTSAITDKVSTLTSTKTRILTKIADKKKLLS